MKKFIASAGLVTVGAVGLQAAYAPGLSPMETSKPWSVSAALRGFYDDNYNNAPSHPINPNLTRSKSSGGFEVRPSATINLPMDQTFVGASYLYSLKYYFERKNHNTDQLHQFDVRADHRFTERYKVNFEDSFVYSAEPTVIDSSGAVTAPTLRSNADAIRNRATIGGAAQITELIGVEASYQNSYYDYLKTDAYEAALNRDEHLFDVRGTWHVQEHLVGLLGYSYTIVDHTSNKPLTSDPNSLTGDSRDERSHAFYAGVEHAFSSQLNGSLRVGAQYTSYDHLSGSSWNPFVDLRGTYTYLPGSYLQIGFTESRSTTDVVGDGTAAGIVNDAESSVLFATIAHRITPKLTGNLTGQFQRFAFKGGIYDKEVDMFYLAQVSLDYQFNHNWSAELGYTFNHLDSDLADRSYSRNTVYGGVRVSF